MNLAVTIKWTILSLLLGMGTGSCSSEVAPMIEFGRLHEDLLEGEARWEATTGAPGAEPHVAVVSPSRDQVTDSGDRLSLILPPPGSVRFEITPEDGEVYLRASAGVDLSLAREMGPKDPPIQVRFTVKVNGEVQAQKLVRTRFSTAHGEVMNNVYYNSWASFGERDLPLEPGDQVELSTEIARGPTRDLGPIPAAFGSLRLEKRTSRETQSASPERPNLLLLVMDTERQDRLTPYGYERETTPNLQQLADRGLVFDEAYATSSWTWPSMASMLTGRAPTAHGVRVHQNGFLAYEFETLAEVLQEKGFRTGAFLANPLISDTHNYNQGFKDFHTRSKLSKGDAIIPKAIEWLLENGDRRFFLYLHLTDPHAPHLPSQEELERFTGYSQHLVPPNHLVTQTFRLKGVLPPGEDGFPQWEKLLRKGEDKWYSDVYDASVHQGDRWLGVLLKALGDQGLLKNTVIAYTADHGEELLDHRGLGHGHDLWQELIKVPLILAGPGIPGDKRVSVPVSNRHLAPTLARIGGTDLATPGEPVMLLSSEQLRPTPVFFETHEGWWKGRTASIYGVREGDWVLHWCLDGGQSPDLELDEGGETRLYHLGRDPGENNDLSDQEHERVERLKQMISSELQRWSSQIPSQKDRGGWGTQALMEAMGYAGGEED